MIPVSLLLILVAVTLLVFGLSGGSSNLLISSIVASLLAAVALVIGARRAAGARRSGAGDVRPERAESGFAEPAYGAEPYAEPHAEPQYADAQHADARYADARYADAQYTADPEFAGDASFVAEPQFAAAMADEQPGRRRGDELSDDFPSERAASAADSATSAPRDTGRDRDAGRDRDTARETVQFAPADVAAQGDLSVDGRAETDFDPVADDLDRAAEPSVARDRQAPDYDRASDVINAARSEHPAEDAWRRDPQAAATPDDEFDEPDADDPDDEPLPQSVRPADAVRVARMDAEVLVVDGRPRYHLADCSHLVGKLTEPIPVNEAVELGFSPCGLCRPVDRLVSAAARR
jgi:hypothetical protein